MGERAVSGNTVHTVGCLLTSHPHPMTDPSLFTIRKEMYSVRVGPCQGGDEFGLGHGLSRLVVIPLPFARAVSQVHSQVD